VNKPILKGDRIGIKGEGVKLTQFCHNCQNIFHFVVDTFELKSYILY